WPGGQAPAGRPGGTMMTPAWLSVGVPGATTALFGMGTSVTSELPDADTPPGPDEEALVRLPAVASVPAESNPALPWLTVGPEAIGPMGVVLSELDASAHADIGLAAVRRANRTAVTALRMLLLTWLS